MQIIEKYKTPTSSVIIIALLNLLIFGCSETTSPNKTKSESNVNSENVANVLTNKDGLAVINSNTFGSLEFIVQNEANIVLENIQINYYENENSVFIEVIDPDNNYGKFYFWGNPNDLPSSFSESNVLNTGKKAYALHKPNVVSLIIILGIATVISVGVGTYQAATSFQKIDKFWTTDVVYNEFGEQEGVVKTIPEIAELMKNQIGAAGGILSIGLGLVSAGTATLAPHAFQVGVAVTGAGVTVADLSGYLLELIKEYKIEQWRQNEISMDTKFLVKQYSVIKGGIDGDPTTMPGFDIVRPWIEDVPADVNDFLTEDDINILSEKGLVINKGFNPPNIEGNYYLDSWKNLETGANYINYSYKFDNQTPGYEIKVYYTSEGGNSTAEGQGAFISGENNSFSVYADVISINDEGSHIVTLKTATIYSGVLASGGIIDFQKGFIVTEKENDIDDKYMDVGQSRVVYESDGLAEKVSTYPFVGLTISKLNLELQK